MKTKISKIMRVVTPVMLVLLLALNVFTLYKVYALENGYDDNTEDVAQENDVSIGDYVIKSTTQISDAYKSGDSSKLSDKDKETLDMAKSVLDGIITDGMTDYEKELAVYRWMTSNIGFDENSLSVIPESETGEVDNPYGVLKYRSAVCVGYATTFRLFMQMMNIDCMVVHDSNLSHSWDLVKLDGKWYHTDIYADTPGGNFSHFNVSDRTMMNINEWNTDFFPAADGYEYNYAYMNKTKCSDVYTIPELLRAAIDSKKGVLSFDFGEKVGDDTYNVIEAIMSKIEETAPFTADKSVTLSWEWLEADGENVFCIYINYEDNGGGDADPEDGLDAATRQRIDSAVTKAFGESVSSGSEAVG